MINNLVSTKVLEWPALALGRFSGFKNVSTSVHFAVSGSKTKRSLKQNACGPDPPKRNNMSLTLQRLMPALGAGLSP